jgi:hypothetical protein
MAFLLTVPTAAADTVTFKDGTQMEGIIKKVAEGRVALEIAGEEKVFDILDVTVMDFTTPHLLPTISNVSMEHFLADIEAREMVAGMEEIDKAADEIRLRLTQIKGYWEAKEPISPEQLSGWDAAKDTFTRPVNRYQELLNDLYFHVLAKVDQYNDLMREAGKVYVGVKGPFNIGSALVPKELEKLPLRKYVPGAWYDTIYYSGYDRGYEDAYLKFATPYTAQPSN